MNARAGRVALFALLALTALAACSRDEPAVEVAAPVKPRVDERLEPLFSPCSQIGPFTADTQDLLEIQVTKLVVAEALVAARVRADLLAAGPAALPAIRRAFERWYAAMGFAPRLVPLLELSAQIAKDGAGREEVRALARRGLAHPSDTVQGAAVRALGRTGTPADYDLLYEVLGRARGELEQDVVVALHACDRERLARDAARWIEEESPEARLVANLAPRYAAGGGAPLCAVLLAHPELGLEQRLPCVAAGAAAGDAQLAEELRTRLRAEVVAERELAARAALAAGLAAKVADALAEAREPQLASLALEALAALPDSPERRAQIAAFEANADPQIAQRSLETLCARGDPAAIDRALALLTGGAEDVRNAMSALRVPLSKDEALARHTLGEIANRVEGGARTGTIVLEKAAAQIPLREAACLVVERALAGGGDVQGMRAHRWGALQAANSGAPGRGWMRAQWGVQPDALLRLDLIEGGCQEGSPDVIAFLALVLESPRSSQDERLFAAALCARLAPASQAAPLLKRSVGGFTEPAHLRAFHCLLWRFYGPEE